MKPLAAAFVLAGVMLIGGAVPGVATAATAAATPDACASLHRHGRTEEARACETALAHSSNPYFRAEGAWALGEYSAANNDFRALVAAHDDNALYRVRWGRLLHQRFNDADAESLFKEALQRDPKNAGAYLGLALVSADSFDGRAEGFAAKAAALDPGLTEAHELLASLALEDSDPVRAAHEADAALKLAPDDATNALAIHAAIELLADRDPEPWLKRMLAVNPHDGEGCALVAYHLVLNRRYEDGVTYYRKAIALEPDLWSAHAQLGINLMRLGRADEARQELEACYAHDYRDAATVNSLRLLDSYSHFDVITDGNVVLKLDKSESALLRPYVEQVAHQAIAAYQQKYGITIDKPVQIELYPNHDDFAVRTYGMPGLGALGVTFDTVIAMDSPSGRTPGTFNWASTLWHELDHVFVLTITHDRAPRWFAEGLAVHEEGQANPAWANRLTPDILVALKDHKLLPIAELDRGFVHPDYPGEVLVSYFEAGKICDFIQARWGAPKLVELVHAFDSVTPTVDVLAAHLGMPAAAFDQAFQSWLYHDVGDTAAHVDEWRQGLVKLLTLFKDHQDDQALAQADVVRRLYPEYVDDGNPYEVIAQIDQAKGDHAGALTALLDYQKFGGEDPATLKALAAIQQAAGQSQQAAATLDAINDIYPVHDEDLHRRLGALWLAQHNATGAVREYTALVALHPLDTAGAEYGLAQAWMAAGDLGRAETHVLSALEAAPGYRDAQKLLLDIEHAKGSPRVQ
jgi:tetratricopeptide (TPR) repeat protein